MKITQLVVFGTIVSSLAAAPGAGKGGGNAGGNRGGGVERPAFPPAPGQGPGADADAKPSRHDDRGIGREAAPSASDRGKGAGKPDRAASGAAHDLAGAMHDINRTAFAQRRELHETLDMRLQSSRNALKRIQTEARDARAEARADFKAALKDVKARENGLHEALKNSRQATEANWEVNRRGLARAYQDHRDALERLEATLRPPALPKPPSLPPSPALPRPPLP